MADAQLILELSKNFFRRNNPVEMVFNNIWESWQHLRTFRSQMKLMKYRYALEQQKFKRIENSLSQASPTTSGEQGSKFNKRY